MSGMIDMDGILDERRVKANSPIGNDILDRLTPEILNNINTSIETNSRGQKRNPKPSTTAPPANINSSMTASNRPLSA